MITEVELSIIPQDMVERETFETSFWDFADKMQELQDDFLEAVNVTSSMTVAEVLAEYEGTQVMPLEISKSVLNSNVSDLHKQSHVDGRFQSKHSCMLLCRNRSALNPHHLSKLGLHSSCKVVELQLNKSPIEVLITDLKPLRANCLSL